MTSTTRQVEVPARQTQYTLPRKFLQGSKLHLYLAVKEPEMIQANKLEYTLFVVSIDFSYLTDRGTYPQLPTQPKKNCSGSN